MKATKKKTFRPIRPAVRRSLRHLTLLTTALSMAMVPGVAFAAPGLTQLPTGGNITSGNGSATISSSGSTMTINQSTNRAIINWNSFNVGQNATVNINQPGTGSWEVERVTGTTAPSQIFGKVNSNGGVMVLNPDGVEFGPNSQVNVNSLVASTGTITDSQVMSGSQAVGLSNMNAGASVVTDAGSTITVADAGLVALVGAQAANNGTINARLGHVTIGGAEEATLDLTGDGLLSIVTSSKTTNANVVSNTGTINDDGGLVELTASAAAGAVNNLINMSGVITADAASVNQNGSVVLDAQGTGITRISGTIHARNTYTGGTGGSISVSGPQITLASANLDASGDAGGGTISLAAANGSSLLNTNLLIDSNSNIIANALTSGAGGTITADSTGTNFVQGNLSARGFSTTDSGSVTIFAPEILTYSGTANLLGETSGAATGMLNLVSGSMTVGAQTNTTGGFISAPTLEHQLDFSNVTLVADSTSTGITPLIPLVPTPGVANNIHITQAVNTTSDANATHMLMLDAGNTTSQGSVTLDQGLAVQNLGFETSNNAGLTVGGNKVTQLAANNVTLDTAVSFSKTLTNDPNTITVGHTLGNTDTAQVQQAFNWIQTGGTVFVDGIFRPIHPTVTKAFTLTGISPDAYISHIIIDNEGFNVTYNNGHTTIHVPFVTLNVANMATGLMQMAYDLTAGPGNGVSYFQLGQNFYADTLNYYNPNVNVESIAPGSVDGYGNAIIQNLILSTPGGSFSHTVAPGQDVYVLGENVTENSGSDAQRALDMTLSGGNTYFNFANYNETIDVTNPDQLFSNVGSTTFNTIDIDNANATYSGILGNTVNANQGAAQTAYDITNVNGTLNLAQLNYTTLDADKSDVTVNGDISYFNTVDIDAPNDTFTNILASTVNDNQGTAQQGYDITNVNGTLNLGQSTYTTLDADTNGVIVNGAAGGSLLNTLTIDNGSNTFNNISADIVNANHGSVQTAYDLTATGGTLNLGHHHYASLDADKSDITVNGKTWGTLFNTLTLDSANNSFNNVLGKTVNDNQATAQQGYDLTKSGGTLNLGQIFYTSLDANKSDVTVNGDISIFNNITLDVANDIFNNVLSFNVTENSGSNAQEALDLTIFGGNTFFNFANYGETINVNKFEHLFGVSGGHTIFDTIDVNSAFADFTRILGNTVNANQGTAQNGYDITNANGTLNLGQTHYTSLDANKSDVTVNGDGSGTLINLLTLDTGSDTFSKLLGTTVNDNQASAQQGYNLTNVGGTLNLGQHSYSSLDADKSDVTVNGKGSSGTLINLLTLDTGSDTFHKILGTTVNDNQGTAQQGYDLTNVGGTLNLAQLNYTTLDADKSDVTVNGDISYFNTVDIDAPNDTFTNILASTVNDNQGTAQQGYDITNVNGTLNLGQSTYTTLDADTNGVIVNGAAGDSAFNSITLDAASNSFNNVTTPIVNVNFVGDSQQGIDLVNNNGTVNFGFNSSPESIDVARDLTLNGAAGGTLFDTVTIDNGSAVFGDILGNTVNANQGTAQNGYDITNANGTLNLGQSTYTTLDADTNGVIVNGAAGDSAFNSITLDALNNTFNNITTPVVNVNAVGDSQQGINLVNLNGTVNFGFNTSPEAIVLNRNVTLNGLLTGTGNTTFGQLDIDTVQGQLNNIFAETVNLNSTDLASRGVGVTALGGTLNLSQQIYVPESLNVPYFMTINGAPTFSLFETVTNNVGAILNRIFALTGPNANAQGLDLLILDPNSQLANGQGLNSLEALLNGLAPAGPGDGNNPRVCTAHDAQAAGECVQDALASGRTVVVFDITKNKFSLIQENATNQQIDWHDVTQEELNQILGTLGV